MKSWKKFYLLILEKNVSYFKVIIELDKLGGVHAVL